MFENLYTTSSYSYIALSEQISFKLLLFAYVGTSIVAILFGIFLWKKTKKLSSLYLLLISLCYGVYCFFNLSTWVGNPKSIMFSWSLLDIFSLSFFFLSYWFLYSFIKNEDLPLWQKIISVSTLIPTLYITVMNIQLDTFETMNFVAWESEAVSKYDFFIQILFIIAIALFTFFEYRKAIDNTGKKKAALAGLGVLAFLSVFYFFVFVGQIIEKLNIYQPGTTFYYNLEVYGLFGMPILLALLGYLIMKYQAFELKLIKSVALVIALMLILFVSVFV